MAQLELCHYLISFAFLKPEPVGYKMLQLAVPD